MVGKKLNSLHLAFLLCLFVFAFTSYSFASQKDGLLKINFFDVGQGDAIFIETPSGYQILIDGGPDNSVLQKLGQVLPFYDKDLDFVILTHPHADHLSGLVEVLRRYEVKNIAEFKMEHVSSEYDAWRSETEKENANQMYPKRGDVIDFGDGVYLITLYPHEAIASKNPNDGSLVLMLKYGQTEIILTGDVELKGERNMISEHLNLDADILKVAHHGSKTSTTEEFIAATTPDIAVISVGTRNRYGHPSPEVLSRFENFDIKYYRTDIAGDVKVISDGNYYRLETEN